MLATAVISVNTARDKTAAKTNTFFTAYICSCLAFYGDTMRPILRLLLFDVILATIHLASDIFLVYSYFFLTDDPWWGGVTIVAICLPGLLGNVNFQSISSSLVM